MVEEETQMDYIQQEQKPKSWKQELASLVDYNGSTMSLIDDDDDDENLGENEKNGTKDMKEMVKEFAKGVGEMGVELSKSFGEIVKQSFGDENCFVVRKFGKPVGEKLGFLNEYLPEDKDPMHSWSVIFAVFLVALLALSMSTPTEPPSTPRLKQVHIHPPNATRVLLPDGRYLAYDERGVSADTARYSMILPHSFLSSRLAGVPGLKDSLLEEFGIRLVAYDLPGFGESDPHPERNLESSALDMSHLADAVGIGGKFWVLGYSGGSIHVWGALRYIPERLEGVAMFAPMVNPYDPSMTKEERVKTWQKWTSKRKLVYILARRFPRLLRIVYRRSFFSGKHGTIDKWLSLSLGKRDRLLIEEPKFEEFWQRNVEESIRQGNAKPFVEEAVLHVSNWGFSIADIQARKKQATTNILSWLKSMYNPVEDELTGFLGSIHIWQGMDDRVVPPSMTSFVHRNLPGATIHMLPNDGHFTYLFFCDECHRQMLTTLFGTPQGPLPRSEVFDAITNEEDNTEEVDEASTDNTTTTDEPDILGSNGYQTKAV